jgi:hypothetical protein
MALSFKKMRTHPGESVLGKVVMFKLTGHSSLCEDWSTMEKRPRERGCGIYISGHPLDDYKFEMKFVMLEALEKFRATCG